MPEPEQVAESEPKSEVVTDPDAAAGRRDAAARLGLQWGPSTSSGQGSRPAPRRERAARPEPRAPRSNPGGRLPCRSSRAAIPVSRENTAKSDEYRRSPRASTIPQGRWRASGGNALVRWSPYARTPSEKSSAPSDAKLVRSGAMSSPGIGSSSAMRRRSRTKATASESAMLTAAGPITTIIRQGRMKRTTGIMIFTGTCAAFSSARCRRFMRISADWTRSTWAMPMPMCVIRLLRMFDRCEAEPMNALWIDATSGPRPTFSPRRTQLVTRLRSWSSDV